jgi:hypothetical protein
MGQPQFFRSIDSNWPNTIALVSMLLLAFFCSAMIDVLGVLIPTINSDYYVGDFTVFWAAAQSEQALVYDPVYLTEIQKPITGDTGLRPFVYPPSFLIFIRFLGLFDHQQAFALWSILGVAIFIAANRSLLPSKKILLSLISPAIFVCLFTGQSTLIVGGLLISGLALINRNQILAGLFIALAATLKPQMLIMVPLALMVAGHWKTLASAILAGAVIGLFCLTLQGYALWLDWIFALQDFLPIIDEIGLPEKGFTPTTLVIWLGLSSPFDIVLKLIAGGLGIVAVAAVFRRTEALHMRVIAIVAGGLLCSPYAMNYELSTMQPALLALLLKRDTHPIGRLSAALCFSTLAGPIGIIMIAIFLIFFTTNASALTVNLALRNAIRKLGFGPPKST